MPRIARPVPTTNEEVFRYYFPYIKRLVFKAGVSQQNVEDVAMRLLTRFIELDRLSTYDPEHTTAHDGVVRKTSFETYLSGFVFQYVRYIKGREQLETAREPNYVDETIGNDSTDNRLWLDVHGFTHEDTYEELELEDLVLRIHKQLGRLRTEHQCNFPEFFDAVREQVATDGKINLQQLSTRFGVSKTSIQNWMKTLRTQVTVAMAD